MKCGFYKFVLTAVLVSAAIACGAASEQPEANKLAGEANKLTTEADTLIKQTEARNRKLFDADVQTADELSAYRIKMKPEALRIIENYTKASEMLAEAAQKFDAAARLNVQEIYKDYARTKRDEFSKRAEAFNVRKGNARVFVEIESPEEITGKFDENNSRFEKLLREAEERSAAAKKIEIENRDFFAEFK